MNAALKPITTRCIEPAKYDNRNLNTLPGLWVRDNEVALKARWELLGRSLPVQHPDSFYGFCASQWDLERLRQ